MHPTDQELKELKEHAETAARHHQMMMDGARPSLNIQAARMTGREVLASQIEQKRNELAQLDALYRALPLELPYEADQALFELLVRAR